VRLRGAVADDRVGVVIAGIAHAAEAPSAGADVGLQDRFYAIAERQVGVADDAGGYSGRAEHAACAHCGDAVDELGLADWA
jgi:hypothetical protein